MPARCFNLSKAIRDLLAISACIRACSAPSTAVAQHSIREQAARLFIQKSLRKTQHGFKLS